MSKLSLKLCSLCQKKVALRYRIQYDKTGIWFLVCPECRIKVSTNNEDYRYGGTWKARKKNR